jgi:hypothetical protein
MGRTEYEFSVGESVYVKLQQYVQGFVATHVCDKLSFKFFGPYQIVQWISKLAYKLLLPESVIVHPMFHVSQLKKFLPPAKLVSTTMPTTDLAIQYPA